DPPEVPPVDVVVEGLVGEAREREELGRERPRRRHRRGQREQEQQQLAAQRWRGPRGPGHGRLRAERSMSRFASLFFRASRLSAFCLPLTSAISTLAHGPLK